MQSDMKPPNELVKGPIKSSGDTLNLLNICKIKNKKKPEITLVVAVVAAATTIIKIDLKNVKFESDTHDRKHENNPANIPAVMD